MHFATLASGSSGNAIVIGKNRRQFLVDSGLPGKKLMQNMQMIGLTGEELEGIIVTHEHRDHIHGVGIAARKYKIPIYATEGIWEEMERLLGPLTPKQKIILSPGEAFAIAGLDVRLFATSHDSRESYGLSIRDGGKRLGIATDTGMITGDMHNYLKGCDALIVEANHDEEMLWQGSYPWYLKKRVSSNRGHLSNKQLGEALREWVEENTQKIVLAHLSAENNTPAAALRTVIDLLKDRSRGVQKKYAQLRIRVAPRYEPHPLSVLDD